LRDISDMVNCEKYFWLWNALWWLYDKYL